MEDYDFTLTAVHNALGKYQGTKTVCKGAGDKSKDTQRPAGPDDKQTMLLIPPYKISHHRSAKVGYARGQCPNNWYVWAVLEFWELHIVVLENTERDGET